MDYRYYRGDAPTLPHTITRHFYLLRYLGALLIASAPVIGVMMILDVFVPTMLCFFTGMPAQILGFVFISVGKSYNNRVDRSK